MQLIGALVLGLISISVSEGAMRSLKLRAAQQNGIQVGPVPVAPVDGYRPPYIIETLRPAIDSRVIYVSSSLGNDFNSGFTESSPKQTINAAKALLRDGFPDWMMLRRGDAWNQGLGDFQNLSGRSISEPMVITSYGPSTTRPRLNTGLSTGLSTCCSSTRFSSHVVVSGIYFTAQLYTGVEVDAPDGLYILGQVDDWTIEDCRFENYFDDAVLQAYPSPARHGTIRLIGNIIIGGYRVGDTGHAQGIYAELVDRLILDGNVFFKNGWNPSVPGANATVFRHAAYLQSNLGSYNPSAGTGTTVRNNIFFQPADGLQMRSGGLCEENLFVRVPIAILGGSDFGGGTPPDYSYIRNNVIIEGTDMPNAVPALPRGWAIGVQDIADATIEGNLIANNLGNQPSGISFYGATGGGISMVRVRNNTMFNWRSPAYEVTGSASQIRGLQFEANVIQDSQDSVFSTWQIPFSQAFQSSRNEYSISPSGVWAQTPFGSLGFAQFMAGLSDTTSLNHAVSFQDPNRNLATYNQAITGQSSTEEGFMQDLLERYSRLSWDARYSAPVVNSYIREGFQRR